MKFNYKKIATTIFGSLFDRYEKSFEYLKPYIKSSNLDMNLRTWICTCFFFSMIALITTPIAITILDIFFNFSFELFIYLVFFVSIASSMITFTILYVYPIERSKALERGIELELPFALSHMNAIASSGVPPEYMFELLMGFEEYPAISQQAKLIVRNIKDFGMSSVKAIQNVAERTPSTNFSQILDGMASTIEKGGSLTKYLTQMSDKALFEYRLKREEYLKTLSMYADIYTALLVAAPLMMLAVLAILNIIGGEVMGFTINDLITLITIVVLPLMNIGFIAFVHMTHPGM
jgi:flagellar protein FlaJ